LTFADVQILRRGRSAGQVPVVYLAVEVVGGHRE
jgi:hypothetical protein